MRRLSLSPTDSTLAAYSRSQTTIAAGRPWLLGTGKDVPTTMPLDVDKYRPYLDGYDLTEDQKIAMIEALWSIAEAVSDLAYGVHGSQLVEVANDNDSSNDSNVVEFFQSAANDPILVELIANSSERTADNDNTPATQHKKTKEGT